MNNNKQGVINTNNNNVIDNTKNKNEDWFCYVCKNLNYSFRKICNRCKAPKQNEIKGFIFPFTNIMTNPNINNFNKNINSLNYSVKGVNC